MKSFNAKSTPPKSENLKLKEKSEVISDVTHTSKRSYKFQVHTMVKHLNLNLFKVNPCNISNNHNHKQCMNYHGTKDRRRPQNFYAPSMCDKIKKGQKCPEGQNCLFSHSTVQEHYHYQKYKRQFCTHFPHSVEECVYSDFCSYAHNEQECLSSLIHNYQEDDDFYIFYYKTEWCPFNLTQHDLKKCVYAHNWQDYRRKPQNYSYQPIPCFNWKTKDQIHDYLLGCEMGSGCNMCHGWKQQQYHPSYYKTIKCEIENCKNGSCPNYHSQKEKRIIGNQVLSKCFKIVAKNRIVEGVFKTNKAKQGYKLKPEYSKARTQITLKNPSEQSNEQLGKNKTLMKIKQKKEYSKQQSKESAQKWIPDKEEVTSEVESDESDNPKDSFIEKIIN